MNQASIENPVGKEEETREREEKSHAISSRIGIYRDRGWPLTRKGRKGRILVICSRTIPWTAFRARVWPGTRNTHFYQTLRGLERAG